MLIPRTVLSALAPICDPESTRYALGGVLVERLQPGEGDVAGKPVAVATNGRQLVVVTWDEPKEIQPTLQLGVKTTSEQHSAEIIPQALCQALGDDWHPSRLERAEQVMVLLEEEDEPARDPKMRVLGRCGGSTLDVRLVEGRFPKWRDVVAKQADNTLTVTVDPKLLMGIVAAVSAHGNGEPPKVRLTIPIENKDNERPILISAVGEHGSKSLGLLMPIDSENNDGPYWTPTSESTPSQKQQ